MDHLLESIITVICSVIASSGFWVYITSRREKKDLKTQMLIGLGHDRIIYLATKYVDRGYISQSEYENLHDYLYVPYSKMGGNGSAERVMKEVEKLPIRDHNSVEDEED